MSLAIRTQAEVEAARAELLARPRPGNDPRCDNPEVELAIDRATEAVAAAEASLQAAINRVYALEQERYALRLQLDVMGGGFRETPQRLAQAARFAGVKRELEAAERARTEAEYLAHEALVMRGRLLKQRERIKEAATAAAHGVLTTEQLIAANDQYNRRKAMSGSPDRSEWIGVLPGAEEVRRAYSPPPPREPEPPRRARLSTQLAPLQPTRYGRP